MFMHTLVTCSDYVCTCVYLCVCVYVCVRVCTCVYVCVRVHRDAFVSIDKDGTGKISANEFLEFFNFEKSTFNRMIFRAVSE
jgi:hypothetical protein